MATTITRIYVCQKCGAQYKKWQGRCDECGAWGSLTEETTRGSEPSCVAKKIRPAVQAVDLASNEEEISVLRYTSGIGEFDRVLGGGMVGGSAVLISGEPGIGKSTLLLQICGSIGKLGLPCFYISGEESVMQIKMRAWRLGITAPQNVKLFTTSALSDICAILEGLTSLAVIVVDSVQTLYSEELESASGTVGQVRTCSLRLIKLAKIKNLVLILVGQVTKEGQIAGPKILEHMVDTVLYFEGESSRQYRIIRTVKNRFGSTNEIGVFEMSDKGLLEVSTPSSVFVSTGGAQVSGSCIFAGMEGTRSILTEVQALVVSSFIPMPRRAAIGSDITRLSMLIAILNARLNIDLSNKEIYLNIVGGLKIDEPALDIAVIVALLSAARNIPIRRDTVYFGEVGLSGELRQVAQVESRVKEAEKLGIKRVIMPSSTKKNNKISENIEIVCVKHITNLLKINM